MLSYYRTRFATGHRFALLSYTQDSVISAFYSISGMQFETLLNQERASQLTADPVFNAYVLTGTNHTMLASTGTLQTSGGVSLIHWLGQMASDDPAWAEAGP